MEQLLEHERLVTLSGTGGTGKTFLALHAIARMPSSAPPVIFVALGALRDAHDVTPAVARTVGLREAGSRGLFDQLVAFLARRRSLLVLDNFEHVMGAAPVVAELLARCPPLQVITTSRSSLRLAGERELSVPPLDVGDAVKLLVQRAQSVDPSFELTEENAPVVAEICRRLDGLPLAIELAAARSRLLSPEEILDRTTQPLTLLTGGRRDAPERHRTLRATIDWSHELLDEREKVVFRSLAVFAGGATIASAAAVLGIDGDAPVLVDALDSLVDKGLVRRATHAPTTRLELVETIREYAHEQLVAHDEASLRSDLHATYFLRLANDAADPRGPREKALERLDTEYSNLLAAFEHRLETRDPRAFEIAIALSPLWALRGRLSEGRRWSQRAFDLDLGGDARVRARAFGGAAVLALYEADYGAAADLAATALSLFDEVDDEEGRAGTLRTLAIVARDQGDLSAARSLASRAVDVARGLGEPRGLALAMSCLGRVEFFAGDYRTSTALHEEGWSLLETYGTRTELDSETLFLAWGHWVEGRSTVSEALFERALAGARAVDDRWQTALALGGLLRVAGAAGDRNRMLGHAVGSLSICTAIDEKFLGAMSVVGLVDRLPASERTVRFLGAADRLRESVGAHWPVMLAREYRRSMDAARATLPAEALTVAFTRGRSLSLEGVLREIEALAASEARRDDRLTERELDVLRLVAEGLTNREVARRLVLSERTVHAHLRSTFRKLGVSSRSAATRYALDHGYA
jgi:predicted ATPase/DNA-binding CsgD family transcriptional regulator